MACIRGYLLWNVANIVAFRVKTVTKNRYNVENPITVTELVFIRRFLSTKLSLQKKLYRAAVK